MVTIEKSIEAVFYQLRNAHGRARTALLRCDSFEAQSYRIASPPADDHRWRHREVDDCCRLEMACAAVDDQLERAFETQPNFGRVIEWPLRCRRNQCRGQQRLAKLAQQRVDY